jgi:hypothetical protein
MSKDLLEALRYIAKPTSNLTPFLATVISGSYDANTQTIQVSPLDGSADFHNVLVNANASNGFVLVPDDDSIVCVTPISDTVAFISMISTVTSININGNNKDGLVKVNDLVTKLNNLENKVNTIITTFNAHTHVASAFGSPTTPPPTPVSGTLTPTVKSDLENIKVKQGE